MIFSALETMREIEQEAVIKTKKSRKAVQRRKNAEKTAISSPEVYEKAPLTKTEFINDEDDDDIQPFDEMLEVRRD